MLVYGDSARTLLLGEKCAATLAAFARVDAAAPGIERHAALVSGFVELSELVQGVADGAFERGGADAGSPDERIGMSALVAVAQAIDASWRGGFAHGAVPWPALDPLLALDPGISIRAGQAEGYAVYALYPETYLEAARRSGLGPRTVVIGIRSIGTGLAALVAAALGAELPATVRPVGHPFKREIRIEAALAEAILVDRSRSFAIVDEGPGLSGSSFAAVADWLEGHGVAPERIHFFPGHPGDLGPRASAAHRARWSGAARHWSSFDDLFLCGGGGLEGWVAGLVGSLDGPLEDISGGAWRGMRFRREADWPAANIQQERRKLLARAGGLAWLAKFAGLGAAGEAKLQRARLLHEAGFGVEVAGLRHGFLVERWIEDALPLDRADLGRSALVELIGAYLGFRARAFPAPIGSGAGLADLARMASHNAGQALGGEAAAALENRLSRAADLEGRVRRVVTDNRLHAHEWIFAQGRLIKTDALDHAFAHDLVGCQDVAFDVAGAVTELGLDAVEKERLCEVLEREAGYPVDRDLVAFLEPCYLAFQLGAATMAAESLGGDEARRLRGDAERYRAGLALVAGRR